MKWDPEEVEHLVTMFDDGESREKMRVVFSNHSEAAIISRLNEEGRYFSERKRAARQPKKDKVVTSKVVPQKKSSWKIWFRRIFHD